MMMLYIMMCNHFFFADSDVSQDYYSWQRYLIVMLVMALASSGAAADVFDNNSSQ